MLRVFCVCPDSKITMQDPPDADATVTRLPLKSLKLRTGMALQTRRLVEGASKREAQYFGAIEGKGVMVGPLGAEGDQTGLEAGEVCVVRGFTGQYEFSFLSKVLQTFQQPFAYALLAYPAAVDATQVRQSQRTKVRWPARLRWPLCDEPNAEGVEVELVDLSLHGAMVKLATHGPTVGANVLLTLRIRVDDRDLALELPARVCHLGTQATTPGLACLGMAFAPLQDAHDKVLLSYATSGASAGL